MDTPRRWKVILMNIAVAFSTLQFNMSIIAPRLASLSSLVRDVLLVLLMCIVFSFASSQVKRILGFWLWR